MRLFKIALSIAAKIILAAIEYSVRSCTALITTGTMCHEIRGLIWLISLSTCCSQQEQELEGLERERQRILGRLHPQAPALKSVVTIPQGTFQAPRWLQNRLHHVFVNPCNSVLSRKFLSCQENFLGTT